MEGYRPGGTKTDLPFRQHFDRLDELLQGAGKAIELPDHKRVSGADIVQGRIELRPIAISWREERSG